MGVAIFSPRRRHIP